MPIARGKSVAAPATRRDVLPKEKPGPAKTLKSTKTIDLLELIRIIENLVNLGRPTENES